ncbi:uncharacterized protein LOC100571126 isoform X2 [Acyrthosiphon pisum]|uniref:Uncharacterized protein n=1 Tax=Acyrthosiphon pisum TaxID=7029 RepID=A0A8R2B1C7_ACYPI|nr:uncharacterized protein LOC100571126 isoform X2 [Acyrthosiphon pisum]|eukprot:XP_008179571.2 PREDICTED: uncharacterized protein LOC100571126 isoform X2 [Acyrthosiphon pisum]
MQPVKIKNINKSYMKKPFVVKGRVKFINVEPNRNSSGSHLNAIIFDNISEIEVVAFKNCENIAKLLPKDSVVTIGNGTLREVNKDYKKTKHKYQIILESNDPKVQIVNNDEVNISDFPLRKYTSGADLKTLTTGMIIDVIGVCTQIDNEKTVNGQQQIIRRGNILVDSIPIEVKFYGDKVDGLYNVGSTLFLNSVKYINYNGFIYLSVGNSSSVQFNTQQLLNSMDTKQLQQLETVKKFCQDSTIKLPDQKLSNSSITQSNNNSTIELPEQRLSTSSVTQSYRNLVDESTDERPSTSGSTPSNKRKTHDFQVEEVTSKIKKKTELDKTFSDERFVNLVMNFMERVDNNNKHAVQLRILEFISNLLKEDL